MLNQFKSIIHEHKVLIFGSFLFIAIIFKITLNWVNDVDDIYSQDFIAQNLNEEEKTWIKNHEVVTVAINHGWAPIGFSSSSNEIHGLSVDYFKVISKMTGLKFRFNPSMDNILEEKSLVIATINNLNSLEDSNFVAMEKPYMVFPYQIYTKGYREEFKDLDSLYGKSVAVFKSGPLIKTISENHPKINLYRIDIAEEGLNALINEKVDAYIGNKAVIEYVAITQGYQDIIFSGQTEYEAKVFVAVNRNEPVLASILNKSLNSISSKKAEQLLDVWIHPSGNLKQYFPIFLLILLTLISIITVFALWNSRLNREIKRRKIVEKSLTEAKNQAESSKEVLRKNAIELERLAIVAKETSNGVVITDLKCNIEWVNPAFSRLTGYELKEVVGLNPGKLLQGPETSKETICYMRDALHHRRDFEVDILNYHKSGRKYWVRLKVSPSTNADGKQIFIAIQTDITSQVEYIDQIRNSQEDMNALFSLSPDGIVVIDDNNFISYANEAFKRITGIDSSLLINKPESNLNSHLSQICVDEKKYLYEVKTLQKNHIASGKESQSFKFRTQLKDGKVIEQSVLFCSYPRISKIIYLFDITQESVLEKMKSEFLATAAHELRTPMSIILGYSELLKLKIQKGSRDQMIDVIHDQSTQVVGLLNELLDLARIEAMAGKIFNFEYCDISKIIEKIADSFMLHPYDCVIELDQIGHIPEIYIDPVKVEQAIKNCLSNAFKFSTKGSKVKIRVEYSDFNNREISISIIDSGIGMTPSQIDRIFEKFYRADTSGNIPGTGLGMVLVKEIMERHGGNVIVESELGHGTKVTLKFPCSTKHQQN